MYNKFNNSLKNDKELIIYFISIGLIFLLFSLFEFQSYIFNIMMVLINILMIGRLKVFKYWPFFVLVVIFFLLPNISLHSLPNVKAFSYFIYLIVLFLLCIMFYLGYLMSKDLPKDTDGNFIRNILYLAGRQIPDYRDGYTNRPFHFGKLHGMTNKMDDFADFLNEKSIAYVYYEDGKIFVVFSDGIFKFIPKIKPNLNKVTYVSISPDGTLSVSIAKKDYSQFKDELSFDQLCISLGKVFIDLFNRYKNGEREEIVEYLLYNRPPSINFRNYFHTGKYLL